MPTTLTATEQEMLDVERLWWRYAGAKEQAIREKFGMSATRFYQSLNALIERDDVLAFDPLLVRRLRRRRDQMARTRSSLRRVD